MTLGGLRPGDRLQIKKMGPFERRAPSGKSVCQPIELVQPLADGCSPSDLNLVLSLNVDIGQPLKPTWEVPILVA